MAPISTTGIGSGIDINSLVRQLIALERKPLDLRVDLAEADAQARVSAYGSIKSSLSDFQDPLAKLTSFSSFTALTSTSADTDIFSATTSDTDEATAGTYDINVTQVAKSHKLSSGSLATSTTVIGTGTMTLRYGTYNSGVNTFTPNTAVATEIITIDSNNNTSEGIRDAINLTSTSSTATIINDGSGFRLLITSVNTGDEFSIELTVTDDDGNNTDTSGLSQLAFDPTAAVGAGENLTETQAVANAQFTVDGISIESQSNTVVDVIAGITLTINGTSNGADTTKLTVAADPGPIKTDLQDVVDKYNALHDVFKTTSSFDSVDNVAGALLGDTILLGLKTQLSGLISGTVAGLSADLNTLFELGISTNKDGTLDFDGDVFDQALADNGLSAIGRVVAFSAAATDSQIDVISFNDTVATGSYAVNITTLRTQGTYTGGAITSTNITLTNDNFNITVDGVASNVIQLTTFDYLGDNNAVAADMQTQINADANISGAGLSVTVTYDATISRYIIKSATIGSSSSVEITSVEDTNIGLIVAAGITGTDLSGTIGGETATAIGDQLTGSGTTAGLVIEVGGTTTGSRGDISITRGVAQQLDELLEKYISATGTIENLTDSLEDRLDDLDDDRLQIDARMAALEARLLARFNAMDLLVAQLQSTSEFLTVALLALPGVASTTNNT